MKALTLLGVIFFSTLSWAESFKVPVLDKMIEATGGNTFRGSTPDGVNCYVTVTSKTYPEGTWYSIKAEADEKGPWSNHNSVHGTLFPQQSNIIITDEVISWGDKSAENSIFKLSVNNQKVVRVQGKDYGYFGGPAIDNVICNIGY